MQRAFIILSVLFCLAAFVAPILLIGAFVCVLLAVLARMPVEPVAQRRPTKSCPGSGAANRLEDYRYMVCGGAL